MITIKDALINLESMGCVSGSENDLIFKRKYCFSRQVKKIGIFLLYQHYCQQDSSEEFGKKKKKLICWCATDHLKNIHFNFMHFHKLFYYINTNMYLKKSK